MGHREDMERCAFDASLMTSGRGDFKSKAVAN